MKKIEFDIQFKKNLSDVEVIGIEAIVDILQEVHILNANTNGLGLAYTSSSSYAMHNVCNGGTFKYKGYKIHHFAITENDMLIMVCEDEEENYHYYKIENEDFK